MDIIIFFKKNPYKSACLGFIAGDVLGLPYEFQSPEEIEYKGLIGYGSHNQPLGTWSDDTSFLYSFLAAINEQGMLDTEQYKINLIDWLYNGKYTCHQKLPFDVGRQTSKAITNLKLGKTYFNLDAVDFNGNVGLLRIFPFALYLKWHKRKPTIQNIEEFVGVTNPHRISIICCYYYSLLVWHNDTNIGKENVLKKTIKDFSLALTDDERLFFEKLIHPEQIKRNVLSTGYILDTLYVVVYQFKSSTSLEQALESTIRMGGDTDSNAALVGGLAGYSFNKKVKWVSKIINPKDIFSLIQQCFK
ncbi:hypothetical protein ABD91_21160 [Lysinibacillus sphaericus]|uniref:ADP-ribosylglycohydrolase family protein n=1 Tax=Lysinibacillus sphaericus TaxID=1421 RepID=UPI0018CD3CE2|nr:ADP-ribosylglycohydrolase family protein [Lysinibacillus sphaericus]MBG9693249.1 hypothetical protein [Lysinibacillus sphaericus]